MDIGVAEHGVAFNDIVAIILLVLRHHKTASNPILSELIVLIPSIILLARSIGPSLSVHLPIFFLVHMDGPVLALRWCFNPIGILLWPSWLIAHGLVLVHSNDTSGHARLWRCLPRAADALIVADPLLALVGALYALHGVVLRESDLLVLQVDWLILHLAESLDIVA